MTRVLPLLAGLLLPITAVAQPAPPIGVNLDFSAAWSTQLLFTDVFRQASPWVSRLQSDPAGGDDEYIPLTADGWPAQVPYGPPGEERVVFTTLLAWADVDYPAGTYTLLYSGTGVVSVDWDGTNLSCSQPGVCTFDATPGPGFSGIQLTIEQSDDDDPVRDIHVILPGHENTWQTQPFYPPMLDRLQGFDIVRVMNLLSINEGEYGCDNGRFAWEADCEVGAGTRPQLTDAIWTGPRGYPLEIAIDLVNAVAGADLWLNLQHAGTSAHFDEVAAVVAARLAPDRRVWVELSNEIWNPDVSEYPQRAHFEGAGEDAGLGWGLAAARPLYVERAADAWAAFHGAFAGDPGDRVAEILGGSLVWDDHNDALFDLLADPAWNPGGLAPEALAVAPYFGWSLPFEADTNGEAGAQGLVDTLLQRAAGDLVWDREDPLEAGTVQHSVVRGVRAAADTAAENGVALVAYEAGQHLRPTDNAALTPDLHAAAAHPDMYDLYRTLLEVWYREGGGALVAFSFLAAQDFAGNFGMLESADQPLADAHRFRLITDVRDGLLVLDPQCTPATPWHCRDAAECGAIGGNACGEICTMAPCPTDLCFTSDPDFCFEQGTCEGQGMTWCGADGCTLEDVCCTAATPWGCLDEPSCGAVGMRWCDGACYDTPTCPPCNMATPWHCADEPACDDIGATWCGSYCDSDPTCQ